MAPEASLSVCVVTYERPEFLKRVLLSLASGLDATAEVVVVDASSSDQGAVARECCPGTIYVHAPELAGWMTRSRNEALRWVSGEIVSFLDDDVVLRAGWQRGVMAAFADPDVQAVGGRTCNGIPGEERYELQIGRLLEDGTLTAGFAAEVTAPVAVDHGIGANMSFRRSVLAELGGFRDDYPGTALREDTDIFLRVRALGGRVLFTPLAAVDHRPAPHVRGARFDTRYKLYARRNHIVLLAREGGIGSPKLRRWAARQLTEAVTAPGGVVGKVRRFGITVLGLCWGLSVLPRQAQWSAMPPRREDALGSELRARLAR